MWYFPYMPAPFKVFVEINEDGYHAHTEGLEGGLVSVMGETLDEMLAELRSGIGLHCEEMAKPRPSPGKKTRAIKGLPPPRPPN